MGVKVSKYDLYTTLNLINNTVDTTATEKNLVVNVPLARITGLCYHSVLAGGEEGYRVVRSKQKELMLKVGLDISNLSYHELLQVTNYTLVRHYTGLTMGKEIVTPTSNPYLFLVKPVTGPNFYITSADGRDPSVRVMDVKANKLDSQLQKLIADHDWYYEYSNDSETYNRGAEQRREILLRLRQLNVSDPNLEYKRLANLK